MEEFGPREIVELFVSYLNTKNLEGLSWLMCDTYSFTNLRGKKETGKETGIKSWERLFLRFPDFRCEISDIDAEDNTVTLQGYSHCPSSSYLDGKMLWRAQVDDKKIAEWRMYYDTSKNRKLLKLST